MLTPFLQYISEGRIIRRTSDLTRYTFTDIQEKIYVSFLALALLKNYDRTRDWAHSYADETLGYGGFDRIRFSANDLHNLLAIVDGDQKVLEKLRNSKQAIVLRQRHVMPTLVVRRYLRKLTDDYNFLRRLEIVLGQGGKTFRHLRRQISDFNNLNKRDRATLKQKMISVLRIILPNSDLLRQIKTI